MVTLPLACLDFRFHPPPKAIMITPIYDFGAQIGLDENDHPRYAYAYSTSANGSSHPRDSYSNMRRTAAHTPSLMYYPTDPTEYRHDRGSDQRHSRYQRSHIDSYYEDNRRRDSYSDEEDFSHRYSSDQRHSRYQRRPHIDSYYEDNRKRGSYSDDEDFSHRYSSYPHSYNRTRERPPDDPIAQHPPDYQIQATHQGPSTVGHAPSHGTEHSFGRYSQNTPYPVQPTGSATSHVGGGRPPTSASLYEGRSPFYPPGESSASPPGSHLAPSVMGHGGHAPSLMTASVASGQHRNVIDDVIRAYLKLIPPHPQWMPSKLTGRRRAVCVSDIMKLITISRLKSERSELIILVKTKNYTAALTTRKTWRIFLSVVRFLAPVSISNDNLGQHNFPADQVLLLTDADQKYHMPTRKEMFSAFMWLVEGAQPHDSLFIHCMPKLPLVAFQRNEIRENIDSGHGGQSPSANGREIDGMDDSM